jgi:hypothetical protein
MLDLKRAATGNEELESKEAEDVDVFDLLGKSVFVKIEEVNGYPRVTGVSKCDLGLQYSGELVAVHKEDFSDPDKVAKLGKFAQKMISESNEYKELQKPIQIDDVTDMPLADVKDAEIEEVNPSAVPF